jgi:hypothetical protein
MTPRQPSKDELDMLAEYFYVDGGNLVAKKPYGRHGRKSAGEIAGSMNSTGYWQLKFKGRMYLAHRIVYFIEKGSWPVGDIDHINGDKTDNRFENLRDVTRGENKRSYVTKSPGKTSKFRGVYLPSGRTKWVSRIEFKGVNKVIGYYDTEEEAALAYNARASELGFNKEAFNKVFADVAAPLLVEGVL